MKEKRDPFMSDYLAIHRLVMEWVKHGQIIVAYDYDNTVFDFHNKGYEFPLVIEALREAKEIGAKFIVYSCSPQSRHEEMKQYLTDNNIPYDHINAPEIRLGDFDDGTGKLFYSIFLDDRAGLRASYIILDKAIEIMKQNPKNEEEAFTLLKDRFSSLKKLNTQ